jgi:transposase
MNCPLTFYKRLNIIVDMIIHKAFKFRIYPTPWQEQELAQQFGAGRFVYNHFLRQRMDYYALHKGEKKQSLNYVDSSRKYSHSLP